MSAPQGLASFGMSSALDVTKQIDRAVARALVEVPQLAPLNIVVGLDLRGRGDVQQFRVALPGPEVKRGVAADAKISLEMPRKLFNEMSQDASISEWREAFARGHIKATGIAQYLKLIERVVALAEERAHTRKVRH